MENKWIAVGTLFLMIAFSVPVAAGDLSTPRSSMITQYELVKARDVEGLKDCFTDKIKGRINQESVKKGQSELSRYSFEELVDKIEMGKGQAKIKMKNGRTLTTLIEKEGKWLADTLWFI